MNSKKKSSGNFKKLLLTAFRQIPKDIWITPKMMLIFILNEFKYYKSFKLKFQIGSMP